MDKDKIELLRKLKLPSLFDEPKDPRVYLVDDLVEAAYRHPEWITQERLARIKEFPKLIELIRYVLANPKPGLERFHCTPGPESNC